MTVAFEFNHDIETVYETLTNPEYLVDRCLDLGELSAECDVEEHEEGTTVTMVREMQQDVPKILQKLFGDVQTVDLTEEWTPADNGWHGHWVLQARGQSATLEADFTLEETKGGCRYTVTHSAKAKIPLLGKQVEKFMLGQTKEGAENELNHLKEHLG